MWILLLGIGAGYLINKNLNMTQQLDAAMHDHNNAVDPETVSVTSQEVRRAHTDLTHVQVGDMNMLIPKKEKQRLLQLQENAAQEVAAYDSSSGPAPSRIEGVMMHLGV